jgi:hypothetical protein
VTESSLSRPADAWFRLAHLGEEDAAAHIESAVVKALESGKSRSPSAGKMGWVRQRWGIWWLRSYNGGEVSAWH